VRIAHSAIWTDDITSVVNRTNHSRLVAVLVPKRFRPRPRR
jgi:hypothetical protein